MALSPTNLANYAYKRSNPLRTNGNRVYDGAFGPTLIAGGAPYAYTRRVSSLLYTLGNAGSAVDLVGVATANWTNWLLALWPAAPAAAVTAMSTGGLIAQPEAAFRMADGGTDVGGLTWLTGNAAAGQVAALRALLVGSTFAGDEATASLAELLVYVVANFTPPV